MRRNGSLENGEGASDIQENQGCVEEMEGASDIVREGGIGMPMTWQERPRSCAQKEPEGSDAFALADTAFPDLGTGPARDPPGRANLLRGPKAGRDNARGAFYHATAVTFVPAVHIVQFLSRGWSLQLRHAVLVATSAALLQRRSFLLRIDTTGRYMASCLVYSSNSSLEDG